MNALNHENDTMLVLFFSIYYSPIPLRISIGPTHTPDHRSYTLN